MFLDRYFIKIRYLQFVIIVLDTKVKLSYQSKIIAHLDIKKYLVITERIFEIVKLSKRNKS